jgi:hypothetical protein
VADEGLEVEKIRTHSGRGDDALFELIWKNGEATWEPLNRVKGLEALVEYLEAMGVRRVENLPPGAGKPPEDDPEIFLGMVQAIEFETDGYKISASDELDPAAQSPQPKATTPHPESNYDHCYMSSPKFPLRTQQRVGKKRQDTPHPYPRNPPRTPVVSKITKDIPDSLDIAIAVAKASTTIEIATIIDKIIDKLSYERRRTIRHQVESDPSSFYRFISMPNIVERTVKSAERNIHKAKVKQPTQAPNSDMMKPLVPVFNELLNHSKISNNFLKELLTHQRTQSASVSTSKDPRKQTQPFTDVDYSDMWVQMGINLKDDAEMVDATKPAETADAHTQTEEWLEEAPIQVEESNAANTN